MENKINDQQMAELACNLDDMTPEELAYCEQLLYDAGALDVYTTRIDMKKGRPGIMLTCMCMQAQKETMLELLFQNTTTLGVREYVSQRYRLNTTNRTIETSYGTVHVKDAEGYGTKRTKPEYEDQAAIARRTNRPISEIRDEILKQDQKGRTYD
jgi:uncharacterized protein (DUF111 family)